MSESWGRHPAGEHRPIRFDMLDLGFMQVEPRVPIHVSGFYHRTQQLAGRYGDGLVVSIPPSRDFVTRARANASRGAAEAGRELPDDFQLSSLTTAVVLEPGETLESDRAIRDCGPFVVSSIHYIYEKIKENGGEPPPHMRGFWKKYCRMVEETPERGRHLRVHAGHCTWLHPDEAEFVTPELIRTTCLAGTPDELVENGPAPRRGGTRPHPAAALARDAAAHHRGVLAQGDGPALNARTRRGGGGGRISGCHGRDGGERPAAVDGRTLARLSAAAAPSRW